MSGPKRRSIIWTIDIDVLKKLVTESISLGEVIIKLGLSRAAIHYRTLKKRIIEDDILVAHFDPRKKMREAWQIGAGEWIKKKKKPINELLVAGVEVHSVNLKQRLFKEDILVEKCSECKIGPEWNGKKISLHLDHINGDPTDNRLENLRILCPNCHAATDTYCRGAGRLKQVSITAKDRQKIDAERKAKRILDYQKIRQRIYKPHYPERLICACGRPKTYDGKTCRSCAKSGQPTKIQWPDKEELATLVNEISTRQLAIRLGVSDKAIAKRCKKLEITKPGRGYWSDKLPRTKPTITDKSILGWKKMGETKRKKGPDGTAWCTSCKDFLSIENFGKSKSEWDGLAKECKLCRSKKRSPNKHKNDYNGE